MQLPSLVLPLLLPLCCGLLSFVPRFLCSTLCLCVFLLDLPVGLLRPFDAKEEKSSVWGWLVLCVMEVPVGFLAKLWSFVSFIPFFLMLLILGVIKAAIIGPLAAAVVVVGNSAVIIGLWPAHFLWTYFCIAKTKRLGMVMKIVVLLILPVPMLTWPIFGMLASILVGLGYGYFTPLVATFEAVGEEVIDKLYHCFAEAQ